MIQAKLDYDLLRRTFKLFKKAIAVYVYVSPKQDKPNFEKK